MASYDSDSSGCTITQTRQDSVIEPFYKYWRLMGKTFLSTPGKEMTSSTGDEIENARKELLEALATDDKGWRSIFEEATLGDDDTKGFSGDRDSMLLTIAADWRLRWSDLHNNVFEPAMYDDEMQDVYKEMYKSMQEQAHDIWKQQQELRQRRMERARQASSTRPRQASGTRQD